MILAIVGPTGVGKTKLSIELAKRYNAIVINCDAVQVYKELNIGSAKVKEEERNNIPHYLIDIVNPNEQYTVYNYQKDLREILEQNKSKNIILVGGTGLYLKAGLYNYVFNEETKNEKFEDLSNEQLYQLALKKDPQCTIHLNNRRRLIRYLSKKEEITTSLPQPLYKTLYIGLTTDRENLYSIINKRVDKMMEEGLKEEVESLYLKYPHSHILHNAIGYKELIQYFSKEISLEEAIELIKRNSRHYAKRQYTWFNNQMDVNWFSVDFNDFSKTIEKIVKFIESQNK